MTTDQLINLLAADLAPADPRCIKRALAIALAVGAAAAFGMMLLLIGARVPKFGSESSSLLGVKLLFTSGVVAAALLPRIARPGAETRGLFVLVSIPFVAMTALALAALASARWHAWGTIIIGNAWPTCLFLIPLLAIAPFVAVVLALRTGAPTDETRAGMAAGLVAGGLGATACSLLCTLPCTENSLPAIAAWYGLAIGICAMVGAKLGPSLLRW